MSLRIKALERALNILHEFRLVGFVQTQYQHADTSGINSYEGGNFATNSNNRFMIRRGRIRLSYEHYTLKKIKLISAVFQIDATDRGVVVKDFSGRITDPWLGWFSVQGGIFLRPFGYETPVSTATLESPDLARMNQTLMPGESEIGADLIIESPRSFKPLYIRTDAALVNGIGLSTNGIIGDNDKRKDFIGRIRLGRTFTVDSVTQLKLNGGVSYYDGGVLQTTTSVYNFVKDETGFLHYMVSTDSSSINRKYYRRRYFGINCEFAAEYKAGATVVRGEFITGNEPGTAASSNIPTTIGNTLFNRTFTGGIFYFIQTFKHTVKGQPIAHDLVFKFDYFDPNNKASGNQLVSSTDAMLGIADIRFMTFGVGYIIRPCKWFKLMVYYDVVKNEKTGINGFMRDLKDNVLTIRTQFLFDSNWFALKN